MGKIQIGVVQWFLPSKGYGYLEIPGKKNQPGPYLFFDNGAPPFQNPIFPGDVVFLILKNRWPGKQATILARLGKEDGMSKVCHQ